MSNENGGRSLSFRGGFFIGRALRFYFFASPQQLYDAAAEHGVGRRVLKVCRFCGAVLFLFFITDIHRYGAWYTGGATYIKPWWIFGCILLWLPIALALLLCAINYLERINTLLAVILLLPVVMFALVFTVTSSAYMVEEGYALFNGYIFFHEGAVDEIFEVSAVISLILSLSGWVDAFRESGFSFTLVKMNSAPQPPHPQGGQG